MTDEEDAASNETTTSDRERAWTWATGQIEKVVKPPLNSRGYPVDSWKVPSVEERIKMTILLADWYLRGTGE